MSRLVIFPIVMCYIFGMVQSEFFSQSFGGAGAVSSGSAVATSSSGSFSNSISTSNSAGSSSNSAAPISNSAVSFANSAASSGNPAISSRNSAVSSSNSAVSSNRAATPTYNSASGNSGVSSNSGAAISYQIQGQLGPNPSLPEPSSNVPDPVPEVPEPVPQVPSELVSPIDRLAWSTSNALSTSPVLGIYTEFAIYQPQDLFVRITRRYLESAGYYDVELEEAARQTAIDVGWFDSQLFFDTVGYVRAYFLNSRGLLTNDNVDYWTFRSAAATDLYACNNGVYDTESMINAVVIGYFAVLDKYGFTAYDDIAEIINSFLNILLALSNSK